jgi:hypothetical protein
MTNPYIPDPPAAHGPTREAYERFWTLVVEYASQFVANVDDNANDDGRDYDGPKTAESLFLSFANAGQGTNTVDGVTRSLPEDWLHWHQTEEREREDDRRADRGSGPYLPDPTGHY